MEIFEKYQNIVLDCDGVLWSGSIPIPGSAKTVLELKQAGKNVVYVTNNSTKSRETYAQKLETLGFGDSNPVDINTSSTAAAEYLVQNNINKVFAIGEKGLYEELVRLGIDIVNTEDFGETASNIPPGITEEEFRNYVVDEDVKAVVCGWDKNFSYKKLALGSLYLQHGAKLVGTNPDCYDRVGSRNKPGAGCLIASLERSMKGPADDMFSPSPGTEIVGKPNPGFLERILIKYKFKKEETIMIGDRLDTDVLFGNSCGVDTALVLSGASSLEDVASLTENDARSPNYVKQNLSQLFHDQDT
mmetsp:Transcript_15217/g.17233  ORF Transcript_15217/g.17233 Transcript_15217/m.17233 type:complete len:302 (+) Transcript_15217:191-1096(+)|eukprot:CAMPEP_0184015516 /NCGR_PEP_ID=MMETSP0954-20121128/6349_1 /TAXON_ID=627963 /ORGANISM="Aplanochytrium sp, Strain PBS07" /LENGTH=301 /DNA_ID=CAMNT_0026296299 /DNA_START=69 /DNA_END=974 /DNA_ORIENTATION=-